jgi:hypothetical protein
LRIDCTKQNRCNSDACEPATGCVGGPKDCGDSDPCTIDRCDEATGVCFTDPACDDQNACTVDSCDAGTGACAYAPVSCDDNNACTDDACDASSGECLHSPVACVADDNLCTDQTCDPARGCITTPVCCNDSDACTRDSCDPAVGCRHTQTCRDAFLCYDVKSKGFREVEDVHVADRFNDDRYDVEKSIGLCNPAGSTCTSDTIIGPETHLTRYEIDDDDHDRGARRLPVSTCLGKVLIDTDDGDELLVPAAKSLGSRPPPLDPASVTLDHFRCYEAKLSSKSKLPPSPQVRVHDQFTAAKTFLVSGVTRLCVAADKNDEGLKHADDAFLCYKIKLPKGEPKHKKQKNVFTHDQFGGLRLETVAEDEVCLPAAVGSAAQSATYEFADDYADILPAALSAPAPTLVDWRTKGIVTGVKNQGGLQADWAFSATGALEGAWGISKGSLVGLSEQQIVDCAATTASCPNANRSPAVALKFILDVRGAATASAYPYTARVGSCKASTAAVTLSSLRRSPMGDELALEALLQTRGPVSVVLNGNWFDGYRGGIASPDCAARPPVFAAALIVGTGFDSATSTPYWIVKNSLGTAWGESGYFRLIRGQNKCGIADFAIVPVI